jgi:hypothetical protein
MSEMIVDNNAGMNLSFEDAKNGLPVNWILYTPKTVPEGDFEILLDTVEFKDGKQSLKFLVHACAPSGGWYSPGFCKEIKAIPGETYKVSFWVRNEGCQFSVTIGGVRSSAPGEYETIVNSNETTTSWQLYEYQYTIPKTMTALRIETSILKPGSFWIDHISIEKQN